MDEPEFLETIRRILMDDWDPIGVRGVREAADEYDSYPPRIHSLLAAGHCSPEISEFLVDVEENWMGLKARPAICRAVAEHIVSEWKTSNKA
jgi:hypothetical protein